MSVCHLSYVGGIDRRTEVQGQLLAKTWGTNRKIATAKKDSTKWETLNSKHNTTENKIVLKIYHLAY
jgi:hypothetical protein